MKQKTLTLALTGASGMPYGIRLLQCLLQNGVHVQLVYSKAAQLVASQEMGLTLSPQPARAQQMLLQQWSDVTGTLTVYAREDWYAPMASGSNPGDGMVICPCTMGTLARITQGISEDLITRAADVMLKEKRQLILLPREMPLSTLHLENMLKLSRMGAVLMPPNPGFYYQPETVEDLIDFVVARVLDHLDIPHQLMRPWGS